MKLLIVRPQYADGFRAMVGPEYLVDGSRESIEDLLGCDRPILDAGDVEVLLQVLCVGSALSFGVETVLREYAAETAARAPDKERLVGWIRAAMSGGRKCPADLHRRMAPIRAVFEMLTVLWSYLAGTEGKPQRRKDCKAMRDHILDHVIQEVEVDQIIGRWTFAPTPAPAPRTPRNHETQTSKSPEEP